MAVAAKKKSPPSLARQLYVEIEVARALKERLKEIIGDDEQAQADAVEGETQLYELMESALGRIAEIDEHLPTIAKTVEKLKGRAERLKTQKENLRTFVLVGMGEANQRKLETALGTITVKSTPRQVDLIDEAMIPGKYWVRGDPRLDKQAIKAALTSGEIVPGAVLDNGSETVQLDFD